MIHKTLLKVLACCAAGASLWAILAICIIWVEGINSGRIQLGKEQMPFELSLDERRIMMGFAVMGAVIGLVGGIGWAIEHTEARWRFVGWTVGGVVVGLGFTQINGWFVLAGAVLGLGAGIITALESAGKLHGFKDGN